MFPRKPMKTRQNSGVTRVFIYLRVSTKRQEKGEVSIPSQRAQCRQHCHKRGYDVLQEFSDAISAHSGAERPEFQRMIELALEGGCDAIVVYATDLAPWA